MIIEWSGWRVCRREMVRKIVIVSFGFYCLMKWDEWKGMWVMKMREKWWGNRMDKEKRRKIGIKVIGKGNEGDEDGEGDWSKW